MKRMGIGLAACMLMLCACSKPQEAKVPSETTVSTEVKEDGELILATTTSTKDSGLLDEILPVFEEATGYSVSVISVGSGEAMKMGENGEADVLLVHSPAAEKTFVEEGHADEDGRKDVMYNDFIIVGPKDDPAGVGAEWANDAVGAFKAISEKQSPFISRSDESGTHKKELTIWGKCEIEPSGDWYIQAGTGMGAVLEMANEKLAYTLSDRATWLNLGLDEDLTILCEKMRVVFYIISTVSSVSILKKMKILIMREQRNFRTGFSPKRHRNSSVTTVQKPMAHLSLHQMHNSI